VPGEDEQTVRWLTGGYGTVESTAGYFDRLARNAVANEGSAGSGSARRRGVEVEAVRVICAFVGPNQIGTRKCGFS
jgi:hypothetical protein